MRARPVTRDKQGEHRNGEAARNTFMRGIRRTASDMRCGGTTHTCQSAAGTSQWQVILRSLHHWTTIQWPPVPKPRRKPFAWHRVASAPARDVKLNAANGTAFQVPHGRQERAKAVVAGDKSKAAELFKTACRDRLGRGQGHLPQEQGRSSQGRLSAKIRRCRLIKPQVQRVKGPRQLRAVAGAPDCSVNQNQSPAHGAGARPTSR